MRLRISIYDVRYRECFLEGRWLACARYPRPLACARPGHCGFPSYAPAGIDFKVRINQNSYKRSSRVPVYMFIKRHRACTCRFSTFSIKIINLKMFSKPFIRIKQLWHAYYNTGLTNTVGSSNVTVTPQNFVQEFRPPVKMSKLTSLKICHHASIIHAQC